MKEFLQEVYANMEAGEVEKAKEMLAEKINELDGVATLPITSVPEECRR